MGVYLTNPPDTGYYRGGGSPPKPKQESKVENTLQVVLQPFVKGGKLHKEEDNGQQHEVKLPVAVWFEAVDHLNGRGYGLQELQKHGNVVNSFLLYENYDENIYAVLVAFETVEGFLAVSKRFEACLELPAQKVDAN
jgi:hypothetical protein